MENKENVDVKKIGKDKACNLLKICMGISLFSVITYVIAILIFDSFDFGFIFEVISFVFIVIAYNRIDIYDFQSGKRNIIIAMIPFGWLIIYDFIDLIVNIKEVLIEVSIYYLSMDHFFYYIEPYLFDVTLVANIVFLYKAFSTLNKIEKNKESENYTDIFYDKV